MNLASSHETFVTKPIAIEQWKPVLGWEGIYEVSDMGRVRRVAPRGNNQKREASGGLLKLGVIKDGYLNVILREGGREQNRKVHRLVLESFVGPSELLCNHKNGNKQDNWLENLEWVTRSQNSRHAFDVLGHKVVSGEDNGHAKLTWEQVREIRAKYKPRVYSVWKLAREYGVCGQGIHNIIKGKTWRE